MTDPDNAARLAQQRLDEIRNKTNEHRAYANAIQRVMDTGAALSDRWRELTETDRALVYAIDPKLVETLEYLALVMKPFQSAELPLRKREEEP